MSNHWLTHEDRPDTHCHITKGFSFPDNTSMLARMRVIAGWSLTICRLLIRLGCLFSFVRERLEEITCSLSMVSFYKITGFFSFVITSISLLSALSPSLLVIVSMCSALFIWRQPSTIRKRRGNFLIYFSCSPWRVLFRAKSGTRVFAQARWKESDFGFSFFTFYFSQTKTKRKMQAIKCVIVGDGTVGE